ncbi:hypothetical protein FACS1894186_3690 [Alphaproteobacteria bacterium]|nr:hypothetical protein FACS1894186_3690 [Alphaproteobacteria bacterium]
MMLPPRNPLFLADRTRAFVPLMVFVLTFVGLTALAVGLFASGILDRWEESISGSLTVQIAKPDASAVAAAARLLAATPGVVEARPLSDAQMRELMRPWLGDSEAMQSLPLPALLDVRLDAALARDAPRLLALEQAVKSRVAGASFEFHFNWLENLSAIKNRLLAAMALVTLLIVASLAGAIIYATLTGLSMHREVIALLHQVGAQDSYVASRFAMRFGYLGAVGAAAGLGAAATAAMAMNGLVSGLDSGLLASDGFATADWLIMAAGAGLAVALCVATSYLAVMRRLREAL